MNQDNLLKEIGRSYIVSAFFPSAFFVTLGILLFRGFVPKSVSQHISVTILTEWGGQWFFSFVLMLWVAFFLYSANDVTVKLFEGYLMPRFLKKFFVESFQIKWFQEARKQYIEFEKLRKTLERKEDKKEILSNRFRNKYYDHYRKIRKKLQEHEIRGPHEIESLLPTRLGNVLRASEIYANERYLIEELTIWPRLVPLMPSEFTKALEEKHNHLMFLLNSALLAFINAIISFIVVLFGIPCRLILNSILNLPCTLIASSFLCTSIHPFANYFEIGFKYIKPLGFIGIGTIFVLFGYILYRVGVNVAEGMGLYIRTAFDLYREDLLRQLNWKPPKSLNEEKDLWEKICLFYGTGNRLAKLEFPHYTYYDKDGIEIKNPPDDHWGQSSFES